ncbi:P-loop ATPase, Sll1717 family [Vibrio rumoiensis]|uniref:P-loop ATPase, Sll1717 family n=1 Tax=Vibrio rumoiensis TaxID=76258 RepID=A0ABW7IXZ9_9VIBR
MEESYFHFQVFLFQKGGLDLDEGELESISLDGGDISFEDVQSDKTLQQHLSENIENLIKYLDSVLLEVTPDCPKIFICFDRVDEAWDDVSYDSSKKVITGLVSASDSITSQYKGNVRPIVFLREDIFDVLSINDSNKLREDCGALLHWGRKSLSDLMIRRINYFAEQKEVDKIEDINSLFDRKEMRQRATPQNFLLKRTMMRPRDLISIIGRVIQSMKEKADDPFSDEKVTFSKLEVESIYAAEAGYSDWLKQEILDEWKVQKPVIVQLFNALQNNSSTNFSSEELTSELENLNVEVNKTDIIEHLRFLFDNSIIGFKLGDSKEWKFKCFYPSQGFLDSDEYRVHEGLVRALNLRENRDKD